MLFISLSRRLLLISLHGNVFVFHSFFSLEKIPKIKICHMVAKEHTKVIEGRQWLIPLDVIDSEDADEDASINHDGAALDEEYGSGIVGEGFTEVEDIQKAEKYSSI